MNFVLVAELRSNCAMPKNQNINLFVHLKVAKAFRDLADGFDKGIGVCATAAMMNFLQEDPRIQADWIARVLQLDLTEKAEDALVAIRQEQAKRSVERDKRQSRG